MDISFGSAMAAAFDSLLDGWANRDLDISAFGAAMAGGAGDLPDGWANPDIDIDAFGSAMVQQFVPWAQAHDKFV